MSAGERIHFELFRALAATKRAPWAPLSSPVQTDFILSFSGPERPKIKSVCSSSAPWAHFGSPGLPGPNGAPSAFGSPGLPGPNGLYLELFKALAAQNKIRLLQLGSLGPFLLLLGSLGQTDFMLSFSGPQRLKIKSVCSSSALRGSF